MRTLAEIRTQLDTRVGRLDDAEYLAGRDGFVNEGIRWIQEELLAAETFVRTWTALDHAPLSFVAGDEWIAAPDDFRPSKRSKLFYIFGGAPQAVLGELPYTGSLIPMERIPEEWLGRSGLFDQTNRVDLDLSSAQQGTPRFYALRAREIHVRQPASGAFSFLLEGGYYLPDLVADLDTNVLTIEAPDTVLYGAIAMVWQNYEDMGRAQFWMQRAMARLDNWKRGRRASEAASRPLVMEAPG